MIHRTLAGVRTRWLDVLGSGPTVLLLHGYTDSADTWQEVIDLLAAEGRAAAVVDLPGHGEAGSLPAGAASADAFDEFVAAAIEVADRGSGVVLVGNSLGALLALRAARAEVPGLRSVLALAPPGDVIHPGLRALPTVGLPLALLLTLLPIPAPVIGQVAATAYGRAAVRRPMTPHARARYARHLSRRRLSRQIALGARLITALLDDDEGARAPLPLPTTVWWGTEDLVCPVAGSARWEQAGVVVVTPDAPHCPQISDPGLVIALLAEHEESIATGHRAAPGSMVS